jgi:hypothetical protein
VRPQSRRRVRSPRVSPQSRRRVRSPRVSPQSRRRVRSLRVRPRRPGRARPRRVPTWPRGLGNRRRAPLHSSKALGRRGRIRPMRRVGRSSARPDPMVSQGTERARLRAMRRRRVRARPRPTISPGRGRSRLDPAMPGMEVGRLRPAPSRPVAPRMRCPASFTLAVTGRR